MKLTKILIYILSGSMFILSCAKDNLDSGCYQGVILGKIRSSGGGVAISMFDNEFSNHTWQNQQHVVEALNIPRDQWTVGKTIYFSARLATADERNFVITDDGDESAKPIIYVKQYSFKNCP